MYGKDAEYYDPDSFMSWMNPDLNPRVQGQCDPAACSNVRSRCVFEVRMTRVWGSGFEG